MMNHLPEPAWLCSFHHLATLAPHPAQWQDLPAVLHSQGCVYCNSPYSTFSWPYHRVTRHGGVYTCRGAELCRPV